ncbi:MAG: thioredoxin domain-containing protein [Candidatus Hodarchaeota archaeon]
MKKYENKLIHETSPYLLQHAHNPVDWYPWGEEAFEKAKKEDKPIFLSIGYSTCHWCHVMERESFEDENIAKIMNEHYVAIKVDREERPDIDSAYMNFVVSTTGSGGWPLNVFLTPDKQPFFGGTYFPPQRRYNLPSFKDLLLAIAHKYKNEGAGLKESAGKISEALQESLRKRWSGSAEHLDHEPIVSFNDEFKHSFDVLNGGSRGAPKFPITLELLFNFFQKKNIKESLKTLRKMGNGGIFDHVGGGFHRYSVDDHWLVPHFEKMLYDNALLLDAFSQAYLMTGDEFYREKATKIFEYARDYLLTEDGFYSAQDADSEGEEGKFYIFTHDEIKKVVKNFESFKKYYNISKPGNFEGKNILNVDDEGASQLKPDEFKDLEDDRKLLLEYRDKRVPPSTDTKIVTFWNALMISGLVKHGTMCSNREALSLAIKLGTKFLEEFKSRNKVLRVLGKESILGFLEDHAGLMNAFLDLYEVTNDERFIDGVRKLAGIIIEQYYDGKGRLFQSGTMNEKIFAPDARAHDSVVPSGASLFTFALFKLNQVEQDEKHNKIIESILKAHHELMLLRPLSLALMIQVLWAWLGNFHSIEIPHDYPDEHAEKIRLLPVFNKFAWKSNGVENSVKICNAKSCKIAEDISQVEKILLT